MGRLVFTLFTVSVCYVPSMAQAVTVMRFTGTTTRARDLASTSAPRRPSALPAVAASAGALMTAAAPAGKSAGFSAADTNNLKYSPATLRNVSQGDVVVPPQVAGQFQQGVPPGGQMAQANMGAPVGSAPFALPAPPTFAPVDAKIQPNTQQQLFQGAVGLMPLLGQMLDSFGFDKNGNPFGNGEQDYPKSTPEDPWYQESWRESRGMKPAAKDSFKVDVKEDGSLAGHVCKRDDKQAFTCAVCAVAWEACGQGEKGMAAVLNNLVTRARTAPYPDTICGVVAQANQYEFLDKIEKNQVGADRTLKNRCLEQTIKVVKEHLNDDPQGFTNYHNNQVKPNWGPLCVQTRHVEDEAYRAGKAPTFHLFCKTTNNVLNRTKEQWWQAETRSGDKSLKFSPTGDIVPVVPAVARAHQ